MPCLTSTFEAILGCGVGAPAANERPGIKLSRALIRLPVRDFPPLLGIHDMAHTIDLDNEKRRRALRVWGRAGPIVNNTSHIPNLATRITSH